MALNTHLLLFRSSVLNTDLLISHPFYFVTFDMYFYQIDKDIIIIMIIFNYNNILPLYFFVRGQCKVWKIFCTNGRHLAKILIQLCFVSVAPHSQSWLSFTYRASEWPDISDKPARCVLALIICSGDIMLNYNAERITGRCSMINQRSGHFIRVTRRSCSCPQSSY